MLWPFVVVGIAVGSLYALMAVGMVVLYRATGVLNLAYGALGALGALTAWQLIENGWGEWQAYGVCVGVAAGLSLAYGLVVGPLLAERDAVVKATASLGFAMMILGGCLWYWNDKARTLSLPTDTSGFELGTTRISMTQVIALGLAVAVLAYIECVPWRTYEGGDHSLFLGEVVQCGCRHGDALAYMGSRFTTLAEPELGVEHLI